MRRLPRRSERRPSHERWLVSYADFMTLLFAFFATMYAISSVDALKLAKVAQAFDAAFDDRRREAPARQPAAEPRIGAAEQTTSELEEIVRQDLVDALAGEQLEIRVDRRGVILSIPEAGTFAVGRDELSSSAEQLVARVGQTLSRFSNVVRVEGHTDDVPIHNVRFASNWDLSAARASRVVETLIARGIAPQRLSATGFAEFHPRVPNTSAESRASNRRIDLVILTQNTAAAEEPALP
jgi:chemotaxis protein MotB